jgi:DNA-binding MarR family transcriptional regulator
MVPGVQTPSQCPDTGLSPERCAYKPLRIKCLHGVCAGNQHPYWLKSQYGKVRSIVSIRLRGREDRSALDTDWSWLYDSDMNDSIASAMIHAAHRVEERLEAALAGVGLSCAKFGALGVLVDQDQPIRLSELAAKLTCVRSNVTQLVDRLEADGLVKRTDDPTDRRAVCAEASALGRKRHAAGAVVVNAVFQDVAQQLSAVDAQVLKRALDAVQ